MTPIRTITVCAMALALAPAAASARDIPPLPDAGTVTEDNLTFVGVWAGRIDTTQSNLLDAAKQLPRECADAERAPARHPAWRRDRDQDQAAVESQADDWQVLGRRVDRLADTIDDTPVDAKVRGQLRGRLQEISDAIDDQRISLRRLSNVHGALKHFDCDVRSRIDGIGRDMQRSSDRLFDELSEAKRALRD